MTMTLPMKITTTTLRQLTMMMMPLLMSSWTLLPMMPTAPMPLTLTQMILKPALPSPCPHQWPLPTLTPLHLPDLQCHLQKLDNLQNSLQQLYEKMTQLIAALVDATMPIIPMLAPSATSPTPHMSHQPKYPHANAQLLVPPAPPEPSKTLSNNPQCMHSSKFLGTLPVTSNSEHLQSTHTPKSALGHPLIQCKPHTPNNLFPPSSDLPKTITDHLNLHQQLTNWWSYTTMILYHQT